MVTESEDTSERHIYVLYKSLQLLSKNTSQSQKKEDK